MVDQRINVHVLFYKCAVWSIVLHAEATSESSSNNKVVVVKLAVRCAPSWSNSLINRPCVELATGHSSFSSHAQTRTDMLVKCTQNVAARCGLWIQIHALNMDANNSLLILWQQIWSVVLPGFSIFRIRLNAYGVRIPVELGNPPAEDIATRSSGPELLAT